VGVLWWSVQSSFKTNSNFMQDQELKENFHPLGLFDSIENLLVANDLKSVLLFFT
jgi:hypothetical protein